MSAFNLRGSQSSAASTSETAAHRPVTSIALTASSKESSPTSLKPRYRSIGAPEPIASSSRREIDGFPPSPRRKSSLGSLRASPPPQWSKHRAKSSEHLTSASSGWNITPLSYSGASVTGRSVSDGQDPSRTPLRISTNMQETGTVPSVIIPIRTIPADHSGPSNLPLTVPIVRRAHSFTGTSPDSHSGLYPNLIAQTSDPRHILPLSHPPTPAASSPTSSRGSPFRATGPEDAGPSNQGGTGSPRTSISTNSSRLGWQSGGGSESRTSADDDDPPRPSFPVPRHHTFASWWKHSDLPVSPKISTAPSSFPPRLRFTSSPNSGLPRLLGWRAVAERLRVLFDSSTPSQPIALPRSRRGSEENDRLLNSFSSKRWTDKPARSKWDKICSLIPTKPWSICLFLFSFACFALGLTVALKHILNPDKEALPWREYCSADYPTLYSLQHSPSPASSSLAGSADSRSIFDWMSNSQGHMSLRPLTPSNPNWPYQSQLSPPSIGANSSLSHVEPVGVFLGVFSYDAAAERRELIRQSYMSHWRSRREGTEGVKVKFILGQPRGRYRRAVELEMEAYNDIVMLDIPENMNAGKTHAFFSWAAENAKVPDYEYPSGPATKPILKGERTPQYVVKADDDAFIMLGELERRLRVAPRTKAFWGYLVKNRFMGGECYGLSFDMVQYIASTPALRALTMGKEDKLTARWMKMHPQREEITWVSEKCWIYDHPRGGTVYSHGFLYPSEVSTIRAEKAQGLPADTLAIRGGPDIADQFSSVSRFGSRYVAPFKDMTGAEQVEALIEGSPLSQLRDDPLGATWGFLDSFLIGSIYANLRERIATLFTQRPSRAERYMYDPLERGGTVVVHYIKEKSWFIETMVALLGPVNEKSQGSRSAEAN